MADLTNEQIEAGLTACEAASAAPWFQWTACGDVSSEPEDGVIMMSMLREIPDENDVRVVSKQGNSDCEFVVLARTLLPAALTELLRLRTALADKEREWRERSDKCDTIAEGELAVSAEYARAFWTAHVLSHAADELAAMKGGDRE